MSFSDESFSDWLSKIGKRLEALVTHSVSESIYAGDVIVPLADVQHIEVHAKNSIPGIMVITKHTRWDCEHDVWANAIWINEPEATAFRAAWCRYRSELESETLMDLSPNGYVRPDGQFGAGA